MAQKNENEKTPVAKSVTKTEVAQVKPEPESDLDNQKVEQSEQTAKSAKNGRAAGIGDVSPELIELVTELRDTVKRIDPRKHTEKTLRRVLFNISDILKDIETLYTKS